MAAPSGDHTRHDDKQHFTEEVVFDGAVTMATDPLLKLATATELTIASGAVAKTAGKSYFTIDTESDAASDDLTSITGGEAGDVLFIRPASGARTVVIKHDPGEDKFACPAGEDVTLAEATDWAILANDGTQWVVVAASVLAPSGAGVGTSLASTANGKGAALVGVEDSAGLLAAANVEAALAELAKYGQNGIADPGDEGAIPVTVSGVCAMTSAGAEDRSLAIPTFLGQRLTLVLDTDGGDVTVTSAEAFDQSGNDTLVFDDAGDTAELVAVTVGGALKWRIVGNAGVTASTV